MDDSNQEVARYHTVTTLASLFECLQPLWPDLSARASLYEEMWLERASWESGFRNLVTSHCVVSLGLCLL